MSRTVKVNEGYNSIAMPNGQLANEGDVVLLTDEQFGQLNPSLIGTALSDEGAAEDTDFEELSEQGDDGDGGGSLDDMTHEELDQKAEDEGVEDYNVSDNKDEKVKALRKGGVSDSQSG